MGDSASAVQAVVVALWHSPFSLFLRGWHRRVCAAQARDSRINTWLQPTDLRQHRVPVEMWELLLPQGQAATVLWSFDLSMSLTWALVGALPAPRAHKGPDCGSCPCWG